MHPSKRGTTAHKNSMLQSEYDAIMQHKRLKVLLIILTALAVAVVLFVVIKAGKEEMPISAPVGVTPKTDTTKAPSTEEIQKRLNELSQVPEGTTPVPPPSQEEITKRLDELSKKPDGTTPPPPSQEEIMKRLNELSAKK